VALKGGGGLNKKGGNSGFFCGILMIKKLRTYHYRNCTITNKTSWTPTDVRSQGIQTKRKSVTWVPVWFGVAIENI
jgi:hypothetical protein